MYILTEAAAWRCFVKKVFIKMLKNSQELRIFQEHLFYRTPPVNALQIRGIISNTMTCHVSKFCPLLRLQYFNPLSVSHAQIKMAGLT